MAARSTVRGPARPAARTATVASKGSSASRKKPSASLRISRAKSAPHVAAVAAEQVQNPFSAAAPWLSWSRNLGAHRAAADAPAGLASFGISSEEMAEFQNEYARRLSALWTDFFESPQKNDQPIADSRFADAAWQASPLASFYARAYLLNSEFLGRMVDGVDADAKLKGRLRFAVSQWVDAASPSNFLALNPRAQQRMLETRGESLKSGLENLLRDVEKGKITQTDETAFEIGRNVATSEGAVVFENQLFQLIQYKPLTEKVYAIPFVLVPPCINKFYILDLQPENSLIRYAASQGHTVFVVSWKNPQAAEDKLRWDDYLEQGAIKAIDVAREITKQKQVNALGFCVGGTILASALAVLYARGDDPVASMTLMTALLDFEDSGALDVFIDESQVASREKSLGGGGIMPGRELASAFNALRANDLIWNYVVSNYLEGKQPPVFDLLYWNADSTNLPGPMYAWYLRNMYLENSLRIPNKLRCCGQSLDLRRISAPVYVFAAKEDHIVPWRAAYSGARLLSGSKEPVRYVLGASGHIAGSINSVFKNKRNYWTGNDVLPESSDAWFATASEHPGSWWSDWSAWLAIRSGSTVAAPKKYGNAKYKVIEPAPGRYAKEKA